MCMSAKPAHFSKTKILTMPYENNRHFTAYQNDTENLSNTPNAMILPIPGFTKPEWFVDTSAYNLFLKEIVENDAERSRGISLGMKSRAKGFQKFEIGQYLVGLCSTLQGMKDFLNSVDESKCATISDELLQFFATTYPNWSFAICLFAANAEMKSQPIAYSYEPFYPDMLFYPTMDSHDGTAPKNVATLMDHSFIVPNNTYRKTTNYFTQNVPDFLKNSGYEVINFEDEYYGDNGDCYVFKEKFSKKFNVAKEFLQTV